MGFKSEICLCSRPVVPIPFWHQGLILWKKNFSTDRVEGYVFRATQVCYIYCALYFCYYITSTSEHRTLDT